MRPFHYTRDWRLTKSTNVWQYSAAIRPLHCALGTQRPSSRILPHELGRSKFAEHPFAQVGGKQHLSVAVLSLSADRYLPAVSSENLSPNCEICWRSQNTLTGRESRSGVMYIVCAIGGEHTAGDDQVCRARKKGTRVSRLSMREIPLPP